jgi:hypothetical protein
VKFLFFFSCFTYLVFEGCRDGFCWVQGVAGQLVGARAWGSEGAALGQLQNPYGVVAMSTGGVWVADQGNHRLCLLH